jgi:hypothetical protein
MINTQYLLHAIMYILKMKNSDVQFESCFTTWPNNHSIFASM